MTNEPEAYRIGWVPFVHSNIYLDSRPLIPRTETEYWVDIAIKEMKASGIRNPKVLDLCAGSGCIGVAVLQEIPEASVDFVEINETHHPDVLKNIRMNGIDPSRARVFGGDLFENITDTYDFILTNPPYINPELGERVEKSVKDHEPALALYGGRDGLEIIGRIISETGKYLKPEGILYLEHEPEQVAYLKQKKSYQHTLKDQFQNMRVSVFKR